MAHWYHFATVAPPPGVLVRLRRYPEDTPPYYGRFDFDTGLASSQVGTGYTFLTPWSSLSHWSPLGGAPGAWPLPVPAGLTWRDPFWSTPTDGQSCWLRRWGYDSVALRGNWSTAKQGFLIQGTTWLLPWHLVWKWKPTS